MRRCSIRQPPNALMPDQCQTVQNKCGFKKYRSCKIPPRVGSKQASGSWPNNLRFREVTDISSKYVTLNAINPIKYGVYCGFLSRRFW